MSLHIGILVALVIGLGTGAALAAAASNEVRPLASDAISGGQTLPTPFTAPPSSVSSDRPPHPVSADQDCEGARPSSGALKSLLGRLVRASGHGQGVQCPIPPADEAVLQEGRNPEREAP